MKEYIEVQGVTLKKLIYLTGLAEGKLSEMANISRTTLDTYVNKGRITPETLEIIEEKAGTTYKRLELFLQNVQFQGQTEQNAGGEYWKYKYNELLKENEKIFDENEKLKERVAEQKSLIDFQKKQLGGISNNKKTGS